MFGWTYTATVLVDDETVLEGAHAVSFFVDDHTCLFATGYANVVLVLGQTRRTDAVSVLVADLTLLDRTYVCFLAAHDGVSSVSWEALADHRSYRTRVEDLALGVHSARIDLHARIDAVSVEASGLRWTLVVGLAPFFHFRASRFRVPDVTRWTRALDYVVVDAALHRSGARVQGAGILAAIIDASLVRRTVRVAPASQ